MEETKECWIPVRENLSHGGGGPGDKGRMAQEAVQQGLGGHIKDSVFVLRTLKSH